MKKLGFGFMRLPKLENGEIDAAQTQAMVDTFLEAGFNYFDTAHVYLGGESEKLLKTCLTSRYPRERYVLTDKLTSANFETEADIRPLIQLELDTCGVEYFDYLLMHALNANSYEKYKACNAFATALELKKEGKLRHVGFSFHDSPETLDRILTEQPEMEIVQLQFNYLDVENPSVQCMECYEVCRKHGKPVLVMEPIKGGALANLPAEGAALVEQLGGTPASYAIRFAASFDGIQTVLSGMSTLEQVQENVAFMADFQPLTQKEHDVLAKVRRIILEQELIPCTACSYCVDGCPQNIPIPDLFKVYNGRKQYMEPAWRYASATKDKGKASDCVGCGQCEEICPQKLEIRKLLQDVAALCE